MPTLEWDFFQYANLADGVKPHPYEGNGLDRPLSLLRFTFGADEGKSHSRV